MTKTEAMIVDLTKTIATLEERVNNERSELNRVDAERMKASDQLFEVVRRLAVIEDNFRELKRATDENDRRRWTVVLAVMGSFLTLAVNIALIYFKVSR